MIWILYKNMLMLFSAVLLNFILGTILFGSYLEDLQKARDMWRLIIGYGRSYY